MDDIRWYPRLGDIPGVGYTSNPTVDRRRLAGHDVMPLVETSDFEDHGYSCLSWPTAEGGTSQSPASGWCSFDDSPYATAADVLRRVYEALELPGIASDYHFAVLAAYRILWTRFRWRADVLPDLERLLLIDLALVEARPDIIEIAEADPPIWAGVPAFYYLVWMYEREGYIEDALKIAQRGAVLRQGDGDVQRLVQRLSSLRTESAS